MLNIILFHHILKMKYSIWYTFRNFDQMNVNSVIKSKVRVRTIIKLVSRKNMVRFNIF